MLLKLARTWRVFLAGLMLAVAPASIAAEAPVAGSPAPTTTDPHTLSREDVSAWLDGLLPYALRQGDIAGGVVSIVKDGQVLFEKGYGYADIGSRRPMDPARTIIRPGSISKLFLWTAVMQQVEQGRLDLDADVNKYLDFHIPDYAGRPITLRDIVTHRSGFAEQMKDIITSFPAGGLEHFVKAHLPQRIYPAGEVPAYSNYASALAGYIVQRVSGEPFEVYEARHILLPLGMQRSTFAQPAPDAWQADVALGYRKASEPPQYYEYVGPFPAGSLSTTADDMAKFMIVHLQLGQWGGQQILSADTARAMQAPQSPVFPQLNAMAIGFYETSRNGHRAIAHNGGSQFFHSDLHLLPDDGVGLFISLNSAGADDAATKIHNALFNGFMDRYFPDQAKPMQSSVPPAEARSHAQLIQGYWEPSQRFVGSWFSLAGFFNPIVISADQDGRISLPVPARGIVHWTEIAPDLWRCDEGDKIEVLMREGRPAMIGFDVAPPVALLPVPWWRSPGWLLPAAGLALAVLLLYGLSLPFGATIRWFYSVVRVPALGKLHHRAPRLLSLALVGTAIAYPTVLTTFASDLDVLSDRTDWAILTLETIMLAVLLATTGFLTAAVVRAWTLKLPWRRKASAPVVLLATSVLWWIAIVCHLINFSTNY